MSNVPNNGPSLSGMRTWKALCAKKREPKTFFAKLRDAARRRDKLKKAKADRRWTQRRKKQAARTRKAQRAKERALQKSGRLLAIKEQRLRRKAAKGKALAREKKRRLREAKAKEAVERMAAKLERSLIAAKRSANFYKQFKISAKRSRDIIARASAKNK